MERITINGSTSYDVLVEPNILNNIGELLRGEIGGNKALIVTDSNVAALYLGTVTDSIRDAGYQTSSLALNPGEESKNIDNYVFLLNVLAEREFKSNDLIVALGGGMIGDLTSFAAATYKRGMKMVQVPTTLLAAVDSSVGGKSAVNLPNAKNQVGTIKNPAIVICDPTVMLSLAEPQLLDGYAEIIKYGVLRGLDIIESLRSAISNSDYQDVVCKAVSIKRDVVEMDEGDNDFRQFLNLGHLVGHAIEAASDYSISHGAAVAQGLVVESKCCALAGYCELAAHLEIAALVEEFGFTNFKSYSADELLPFVLRDKRIRNDEIAIIVPEGIGNCVMKPVPADALPSFITLGL